jgi:hypothetical protein
MAVLEGARADLNQPFGQNRTHKFFAIGKRRAAEAPNPLRHDHPEEASAIREGVIADRGNAGRERNIYERGAPTKCILFNDRKTIGEHHSAKLRTTPESAAADAFDPVRDDDRLKPALNESVIADDGEATGKLHAGERRTFVENLFVDVRDSFRDNELSEADTAREDGRREPQEPRAEEPDRSELFAVLEGACANMSDIGVEDDADESNRAPKGVARDIRAPRRSEDDERLSLVSTSESGLA